MLSLNDAMLKKRQEPAFAAPWDALEPEEQIVRAIIEGREENHLTQNQLAHATGSNRKQNQGSQRAGTSDAGAAGRCHGHSPDKHQQARKWNRKSVAAHAQAPCRGDGDEAQTGISSRAIRFQRKITALFPRHRTSVSFSGRPALFL